MQTEKLGPALVSGQILNLECRPIRRDSKAYTSY